MTKRHFIHLTLGALLFTAPAAAQSAPMVEPGAGAWKTWVLGSGSELRLPSPPGEPHTRAEMQWLKEFMAQAGTEERARITYWDAGSPPYRWIELFSDRLRQGRLGVSMPSFRGYGLLGAAMYDATIAAWDSKYAHNRPRPAEFDPTLTPAIDTPRSPSYPSEHAVVAGAAATVLGYLFPADAEYYQTLAEEAARSRLAAGVHYPSDVIDGLELGRAVGRRFIDYARADGTDSTPNVAIPTGPGLWSGSNPGFSNAPLWKPWAMSRPDEFRSAPPPAHDGPERAAELAELRAFLPRSFNITAAAFYWQTVEGVHTWWFDLVHRALHETKLDRNPPRAARAYALMGIVQYDAHIASNDGKFHYWVQRPIQQEPSLAPVFATPNFPSYPSNHSTHSAARAEVMAYLFPHMAEHARARAEEAGLSRLWAGIHFRSDHTAGVELGRAVARKLLSIASKDGSQPPQ